MAGDETYDDNLDGEAQMIPEIPDEYETEPAEGFGGRWSGRADDSAEKAAEFGERWTGAPDDSAERAAEFGVRWDGDNQPPRD